MAGKLRDIISVFTMASSHTLKIHATPPPTILPGVDESSAGSASGDRDIFIGRHLSDETRRYRPGTVEVPRRMSLSSFGSMLVYDETAQTMLEYSSGDGFYAHNFA